MPHCLFAERRRTSASHRGGMALASLRCASTRRISATFMGQACLGSGRQKFWCCGGRQPRWPGMRRRRRGRSYRWSRGGSGKCKSSRSRRKLLVIVTSFPVVVRSTLVCARPAGRGRRCRSGGVGPIWNGGGGCGRMEDDDDSPSIRMTVEKVKLQASGT